MEITYLRHVGVYLLISDTQVIISLSPTRRCLSPYLRHAVVYLRISDTQVFFSLSPTCGYLPATSHGVITQTIIAFPVARNSYLRRTKRVHVLQISYRSWTLLKAEIYLQINVFCWILKIKLFFPSFSNDSISYLYIFRLFSCFLPS
jgi:hypothetical protein